MHGPKLTHREIAATLRRSLERLESVGIPHEQALNAVALDRGISAARIEELVERYHEPNQTEAAI
jgi:hypothetical protein